MLKPGEEGKAILIDFDWAGEVGLVLAGGEFD